MSEEKQMTLAQVAERHGRNGARLWIIYKDDVLDLTEFQYEHPGSADTIKEEAGKDASKAFDEVGHSGDAKKMTQKYKIGVIVECERKYMDGKSIATAANEGGRRCLSMVTCGLLGS